MLIHLQGLVGCILFTYLFIVRGRSMIDRATQEKSKALNTYRSIIGWGMIIAGMMTAIMGIILLVMLVVEVTG